MKKFILIFFSLFIFSSAMAWDQIDQCTPEEPQNNACGKGCYPDDIVCAPCEAGFYNDNDQNTGECEQCTIIPDDPNVIWVPDITGMMSDSCPWTCKVDYYWDGGTKQCKACNTDAGYHSSIFPMGEQNWGHSTSCDIYEITLVDGDTTIGTAYAKKDTGYANDLNGTWTSNGPITTLPPTDPNNWWEKFNGYQKEEGGDFTDSYGYVQNHFSGANNISGPFNATAKWQYAKFNIQFDFVGGNITHELCTLGGGDNPCYAPTADDIAEDIPDGQYLAYWICNDPDGNTFYCQDGETVSPGDLITSDIVLESGTDFGDNSGLPVVLEAYFTTCDAPLGQYCTEDGKYADCPQGTTTLSIGATSIANCVMVGGSNGTKFCDKENRCFNLPEGINIHYTDSF